MSTVLNCEVCCIGGGISGLKSVDDLAKSFYHHQTIRNRNIILVEASSHLGGRIKPKTWNVINTRNPKQSKQITIDLGAAYLHGIEANTNSEFIQFLHDKCNVFFDDKINTTSIFPISHDLLHPLIKNNCNFKTAPIYHQKYDKYYDLSDDDNIPKFIKNVDTLMEKYLMNIECYNDNEKMNDNIIQTSNGTKYHQNKLPSDNISFLEWLQSNEIEIDQDTLEYAQLIYGTEECINIKNLGMRQFVKSSFEWNFGEGIVHLKGQYQKLIQYFQNKLQSEYNDIVKIMVNSKVTKIKYNNKETDDIMVYTQNGDIIQCKYCICSVPITILQSNGIIFEPVLPISKQESISKLYAGNGGKIYLQFNNKFWNDDTSIIYVADSPFTSEIIFNTYSKDIHIVECLAFSKQWEIFNQYSEGQIIQNIIDLLFKMFKIKKEESDIKCLKSFIYDWSKTDNIHCTYSSNIVNSDKCKEILSQPIDNKLFFVGEVLVKSFPAIQNTMETTIDVTQMIVRLSNNIHSAIFGSKCIEKRMCQLI